MIRLVSYLCIVILTLVYIYGKPSGKNISVEPQVSDIQTAIIADPYALQYEEQECLALNIYFEARNQSTLGQIAVAMVVLNRVKDAYWPDTICGVVKQGSYTTGYIKKNRCQFSWYCDGLSDRPKNSILWSHSNDVAVLTYKLWLDGDDLVDGATNYHSDNASPVWTNDKGMSYITRIDNHTFYNWRRINTVYN